MIHEVVDGAARLGRLQTFVGRHAVSESVHNTNLKEEGKWSAEVTRGTYWCFSASFFCVNSDSDSGLAISHIS